MYISTIFLFVHLSFKKLLYQMTHLFFAFDTLIFEILRFS